MKRGQATANLGLRCYRGIEIKKTGALQRRYIGTLNRIGFHIKRYFSRITKEKRLLLSNFSRSSPCKITNFRRRRDEIHRRRRDRRDAARFWGGLH